MSPTEPAQEMQETREITQHNVHTVAEMESDAREERSWGERFLDGVATFVGNERFFAVHALSIQT